MLANKQEAHRLDLSTQHQSKAGVWPPVLTVLGRQRPELPREGWLASVGTVDVLLVHRDLVSPNKWQRDEGRH